jgi:hypothetical protein
MTSARRARAHRSGYVSVGLLIAASAPPIAGCTHLQNTGTRLAPGTDVAAYGSGERSLSLEHSPRSVHVDAGYGIGARTWRHAVRRNALLPNSRVRASSGAENSLTESGVFRPAYKIPQNSRDTSTSKLHRPSRNPRATCKRSMSKNGCSAMPALGYTPDA